MWFKYASIVKKLTIHHVDAVRKDPDFVKFIETAPDKLGKKGKFVIRFSGIPQENLVLAEGKNRKLCMQCIAEFEKLLIKKGYMEHEHIWEVLEETDYGEQDYNSYGGGVEPFVVTLYQCRLCGALHKEYRGDFCGDPEEFLKAEEGETGLTEQSNKR